MNNFGILNQKEARQKSYLIVLIRMLILLKLLQRDMEKNSFYVSPVEDKDTMEYWLRKNKLYAHRASSFCDRNRSWYDLSFKEQLENLCWEFDKNGKLKKTQW